MLYVSIFFKLSWCWFEWHFFIYIADGSNLNCPCLLSVFCYQYDHHRELALQIYDYLAIAWTCPINRQVISLACDCMNHMVAVRTPSLSPQRPTQKTFTFFSGNDGHLPFAVASSHTKPAPSTVTTPGSPIHRPFTPNTQFLQQPTLLADHRQQPVTIVIGHCRWRLSRI